MACTDKSSLAPTPPALWESIPNYPLGDVPEDLPDSQPLLYRLVVAKRALVAGYEDVEQTAQTISDALADLRHLCDALGHDFAELDRLAYAAYASEKGSDLTPPVTVTEKDAT